MKKCTLFILLLLAYVTIKAQDYKISFAGKGTSTTVGTVKVENLTQGKSVSLLGSDVLHLVATSTGINPILDSEDALQIYPNPTNGNSKIDFVATTAGKASVELFDITGKRVAAAQNTLTTGAHSYQINNLRSGIYTVRIYSQAFTYTCKLFSNGVSGSEVKISYIGNSAILFADQKLKKASTEKLMQYTIGDRLKFTGTSGIYSTIMPDIPTQSKTLTFTFIACIDGDGNNYPVVQIGTQIWMGENLKTTKYNDGSNIPYLTWFITEDWPKLYTSYYCWYNNDVANKSTYGALYNWYAVNSYKLEPKGWHIPTDAEWTTLTTFLGGEKVAGGKLRETGISHWSSPNTGATNETGFTALPGGNRGNLGSYGYVGSKGYWWSSTQYNTDFALDRIVFNDSNYIYGVNYGKELGFSVRCVKD